MANGINWGKIYCNSWWGSDSNKDSLPESEFEQCGLTPPTYTAPTNLSINQFLYRQFRLDWTNTAFTGSIELIKIYIGVVGEPNRTILTRPFDPTKPNTYDFAISGAAGNYQVQLRYSDPTNGFSPFSEFVYFTVT